jgi:hypothetical protein
MSVGEDTRLYSNRNGEPPSLRSDPSIDLSDVLDEDWKLDYDEYLHYIFSWETLLVLLSTFLICMAVLRGKLDALFWVSLSIVIIFILFYIYWRCIRSPSQYYSLSNTIYPFMYGDSGGSMNNGDNVRTTADIIDTTSYQSRPAFGRGSSLSGAV